MAAIDLHKASIEVNKMYNFLGSPKLTEQVLEDLADLCGVPLRNVVCFAKYGRINGAVQ